MKTDGLTILVVGNGGREAAIWWKLAKSPRVAKRYCAPGNPGMDPWAECVDIKATDIEALAQFALAHDVDITFIGPEQPLIAGIVDRFAELGLVSIGPTALAAEIEGNKIFALELMHQYGIPTGWYQVFSDPEAVRQYIAKNGDANNWPVILKNPFPAEGKGAFVCENEQEINEALASIEEQQKNAGYEPTFLMMEYLEGEEVSIFGFTDGADIVYLHPAQDHKRIGMPTKGKPGMGEGDVGLNTGGMGAYAPAPIVTPELQAQIHEQIMLQTVRALANKGRSYAGVLFGGIIITKQGPKVLEFNCRLGDPETQTVLPLLQTDFVDILLAIRDKTIGQLNIRLSNNYALCVTKVSGGYPVKGAYTTGHRIRGTRTAEELGCVLFHAGTKRGKNRELLTAGGRVVGVTAVEPSLAEAKIVADAGAKVITFRNAYHRSDIGHRAL